MLGGLLLNSVYRPVSELVSGAGNSEVAAECADSRFAKLVSKCSGAITTSVSGDLGGVGTDPVFNRRSALYNPNLNVTSWLVIGAGFRLRKGLH